MPNHETYGLCVMRVTHYERMHDCTRMHGATYSQSAAYHKNNYVCVFREKKTPREGPV